MAASGLQASEHLGGVAGMGFRSVSVGLFSYRSVIDGVSAMTTRDTATLSAKFQISIPKAVRTERRWQAGQVFAFIPTAGRYLRMG
jgi:hypothetical protein